MKLYVQDIESMDKRYRTNFVNSLPGFKSANLIGTISHSGIPNLAIFSSVIHVGASPALMGMLFRPVSVPRHTYQNIKHNFDQVPVARVAWDDLEHVRLTREFLNDPQRFLRRL